MCVNVQPQPDPKAKQPFLLKNYVKGAVLKPTDGTQPPPPPTTFFFFG
jgi:hypothetical protein